MEQIRERLLLKIEDLKAKIKTNEDFPENNQDIVSLIFIEDAIDEILGCWYY